MLTHYRTKPSGAHAAPGDDRVGFVSTEGRPTLTAFSAPAVIDVTGSPADVSFSVGAEDSTSEISWVDVLLDHRLFDAKAGVYTDSLLFSSRYDTFDDGISNLNLRVGAQTSAGTYYITGIFVTDKLHHQSYYSASDLSDLGFPSSFEVVSATAPDETPPTLTGLSLPALIDLTNGEMGATFSASGHDEGSGIGAVELTLDRWFYDAELGTYDNELTIYGNDSSSIDQTLSRHVAASAQAGTYNVVEAKVIDGASYSRTYSTAELAALGFATSFEVRSGPLNPVTGGDGDDILSGTSGDDRLSGAGGNDQLIASPGYDSLDGGAGVDTAVFADHARTYRIGAFTDGAGAIGVSTGSADTLNSVEYVDFRDGFLTFDPDSNAAKVMRLYDAVLQRAPDAAGLDAWLDTLDAGASFASVAQGFIGSAEFQAATGTLSSSDYVEYLYVHALGRASDAPGKAGWVAVLDGGGSRADVLVGFSESAEHRQLTADELGHGLFVTDNVYQQVAALYDSFADRRPDAAGLDDWVGVIKSGEETLAQVADNFVASPEFRSRTDGLSDSALVDYMYHSSLDRDADAAGRAAWVDALSNGLSRGGLLLGFAESAEHLTLIAGDIQGGIALAA